MKPFLLDTYVHTLHSESSPDYPHQEESCCDCDCDSKKESVKTDFTLLHKCEKEDQKEYYFKIILHKKIGSCQYLLLDNTSIQKCIRVQDYTILPNKEGGYFILYIQMNKDRKTIDFNHYLYHHTNQKIEIIYLQYPGFGKMLDEDLDLRLYLQTIFRDHYQKIVGDLHVFHHRNIWNSLQKHKGDLLFYGSQLWMLLT